MPPDPSSSRALPAVLARASAVLVLSLVAWRCAAGLWRFASELATTPLSERRRALLSPVEERLRATRGDEVDLWLALRPHVAPGSVLFVSYAQDARGRALFRQLQRLRALLCPARLEGLPFDPAAAERSFRPAAAVLVLDLSSGRAFEAGQEELVRGADWRLVRVRAREDGG